MRTLAEALDRLADEPGVDRLGPGKVRERFVVGGDLLLVATDRISAYDVVLPTDVPDKGAVLTGLSHHWLQELADTVAHHELGVDVTSFPEPLPAYADVLAGRSMLCRRVEIVPVECVARGYLAGSGWEEYRTGGAVCGVALPPGLVEGDRLPEPIFTPATKAVEGHDENVPFGRVEELVGAALAAALRARTLAIYRHLAERARAVGLLLADTKLEFGLLDGALVLADEVGTPDSSRYWPVEDHAPGRPQASFDKQFVRDWLRGSGWDRTPPGPSLPDDVVAATRDRYVAAYERLTGRPFADWSPR